MQLRVVKSRKDRKI